MQFLITIPKPCHEDWNKMTPEERGALCSVCNKLVWDFTKKSPDEIKNILVENSSTDLCGRFRSEQLTKPVHEAEVPVNLLAQVYLPKLSRFAVAAVMAFGFTLFNVIAVYGQDTIKFSTFDFFENGLRLTYDGNAEDIIKLVEAGNVSFRLPAEPPKLNCKIPEDTALASEAPDPSKFLPAILINAKLGEFPLKKEEKCVETLLEKTNIVPAVTPKPLQFGRLTITSVGGVQKPRLPVEAEANNIQEDKALRLPLAEVLPLELGAISNIQSKPQIDDPSGLLKIAIPSSGRSFFVENNQAFSIFPNPSKGIVNLTYTVSSKANVTVEVYDMQGVPTQQLLAGEQHEQGQYTRKLDVSLLPAGVYLCVLKTGSIEQARWFIKSE